MNKKMRELLDAMAEKRAQAKGYMEDGENKDVSKAASLLDEVDSLQNEFEVAKRLFAEAKEEAAEKSEGQIGEKAKTISWEDAEKAFATAARGGFRVKTMTEGVPADGGYTVPEVIETKIIELREAKASLLDLVDVIKVNTLSGARTFKKRSQKKGFTKVGEGGKISATSAPEYERTEWKVEKYAGYMPVTNELLSDSDANITTEIVAWMADESRVTANKLILEQLNGGKSEKVVISGCDDIKKILNVTLGQAHKPYSKIVTNDDGLQWLDTLKDSDGNYLLSASPADPMKMVLSAGATTAPVEVIPNEDMPSAADHIPVYIGDFKEAIKYWDRQQHSIKASDVAAIGDVNAYEEDLTVFRGIEREDVTVFDDEAYVAAKIAIAAAG